ncbi:glucose-6-phosphate isomerase [Microbacterium soli]|uniref:Glucose-6-phosphate isomerase n=2 Tax=Microbacterium soli TaxID=446075 RepID=A0ABP7NE42_9MICO
MLVRDPVREPWASRPAISRPSAPTGTNVAVMTAPIDATTTPAWAELTAASEGFSPDLRDWFATDPDRVRRLSLPLADLHVDLSKNLVTDEILASLVRLAEQTGVAERFAAMLSGAHINTTEDRAVLHTALRRPAGASPALVVDGQDVDADVQSVLDALSAFADRVRSGGWLGVTGKKVTHVVNIGIGGSDLGPVMVYEALKPYADAGIQARFVSNIDPTDLAQKTADLDPETTLFIVASKTFTTLETLTNARLARDWMWAGLAASGAIGDDEQSRTDAVAHHFVAVSTALDKVAAFGIDPSNAFGFWDWVGGRYSVDSAIGLSLAVVFGPERFRELLSGFHAVDEHVRTTPLAQNVPVLMGLLNVWYSNFLGAQSHAVLPYAQQLSRFAAYLQQLTMESNGKSVRWDGSPVTTSTGEVFWGEPGTNGQHAFYQLIHQGTRLIPADFIAFVNPAYPLQDGGRDVHGLFLANFLAQTRALAFGKTAEEVEAEGTTGPLVAARTFSGNRPTTSIFAPSLTPSVLGQLIALYEHITFTQGVIWGINSFDQWGVELGKQLALQIAPAIEGDAAALAAQDASTQALLAYYREHRKG